MSSLVYKSEIFTDVTIRSIAPYSGSRKHNEPEFENESADDYNKRTYLSHLHVNKDGVVVIPAFAFHRSWIDAASYDGTRIEGQGQKTWAKKIASGAILLDDLPLAAFDGAPLRPKDFDYIDIFAHVTGKRAPGSRVNRRFPIIHEWQSTFRINILDPILTEARVRKTIEICGLFTGLGRYRPSNGGANGRFVLHDLVWHANRRLAA
jgi:hypothetical protein